MLVQVALFILLVFGMVGPRRTCLLNTTLAMALGFPIFGVFLLVVVFSLWLAFTFAPAIASLRGFAPTSAIGRPIVVVATFPFPILLPALIARIPSS